jgi:hypothetical protein
MIVNKNFLDKVGNYAKNIILKIERNFPDRAIWLEWHGQTIYVRVESFGTFKITAKNILIDL